MVFLAAHGGTCHRAIVWIRWEHMQVPDKSWEVNKFGYLPFNSNMNDLCKILPKVCMVILLGNKWEHLSYKA